MNKILLFCSAVCLTLFSFSSCEDAEWNDSRLTYYATLTLEGDDYIVLDKGKPFEEPGYYAELKGEDVSSDVVVETNLNVNKSGKYYISYVYTNVDGFKASASRDLVVLDPNHPIEGFYSSDPESYRVNSSGTKTVYKGSYTILVTDNEDGTYTVDDLLGGYYGQKLDYGSNYNLEATISIADDGSISLIKSYVPGWGYSASGLTDGKWDAENKTLSWDALFQKMHFYVTLKKDEVKN